MGEADAEVIVQLPPGSGFPHAGSWWTDGETLSYNTWGGSRQSYRDDVLVNRPGDEPQVFVGTEATEWGSVFSPDGRWLAYSSDKEGVYQVYVRPYPGNDREDRVGEGTYVRWSADGKTIYYWSLERRAILAMPFDGSGREPRFGEPRVVYDGPMISTFGLSYNVASDGRLLILHPVDPSETTDRIEIVLNFDRELERLLPAHR